MSWFHKISNSSWDSQFPRAGNTVSGLQVEQGTVPNTSSISASFNKYEVLPGIREVPMSYIDEPKKTSQEVAKSTFYAANDFERSHTLANKIRASKSVTPLIIAVDSTGPYILEGVHRYVALSEIGARFFPALVVIDRDDIGEDAEGNVREICDSYRCVENPGKEK